MFSYLFQTELYSLDSCVYARTLRSQMLIQAEIYEVFSLFHLYATR